MRVLFKDIHSYKVNHVSSGRLAYAPIIDSWVIYFRGPLQSWGLLHPKFNKIAIL